MSQQPYTPPEIRTIGTVAELTRELGLGPGSDAFLPATIRQHAWGNFLNGVITHS